MLFRGRRAVIVLQKNKINKLNQIKKLTLVLQHHKQSLAHVNHWMAQKHNNGILVPLDGATARAPLWGHWIQFVVIQGVEKKAKKTIIY